MSLGKIVVLLGPTTAGKSALALRLASEVQGEIISADSMQIYRHMDIGTAKPSAHERAQAPHHLIDIVDPDESFHAARYQREADRAIAGVLSRGKLPLVVGGTGLYLRALLHGLFPDPRAPRHRKWEEKIRQEERIAKDPHASLEALDPRASRRIHPHDSLRARRALDVLVRTGLSITALQEEHGFRDNRYEALLLGLSLPRQQLHERINSRVDTMMDRGLLEEVRSLLAAGYGPELPSMRALGYRHMVQLIQGSIGLLDAVERLKRDTRRYAKRQSTWFRNQEKVLWLDPAEVQGIPDRIQRFLSGP